MKTQNLMSFVALPFATLLVGSTVVGCADATATSDDAARVGQGSAGDATDVVDDDEQLDPPELAPTRPRIDAPAPAEPVLAVEAVVDPAALLQQAMTYDANGNLRTVTRGGISEERHYDGLDRAVAATVHAPEGPIRREAQVGANNALTSMKDARGVTTSFDNNTFGQAKGEASPDRGAIARQYDAAGRLSVETDARGHAIGYRYDDADRLRGITEDGVETTTIDIGALNGVPVPFAEHRRTRVTDASGQTTFAYDAAGHVSHKVWTTPAGETLRVDATYGNAGVTNNRLTSLRYPSGVRVDLAYGAGGRVSAMVAVPPSSDGVGNNDAAAVPVLSGVAFTPTGEVSGFAWGDGTPYQKTWAHDGAEIGLLKTYPVGDVLRTLEYDARGNITAYRHSGTADAAQRDRTFVYDARNQLTHVVGATPFTYGYDLSGNRTGTIIGDLVLANSVSPDSNRLATSEEWTGALNLRTWGYDASGNPNSVRDLALGYDAAGRLAGVTALDGSSASFAYNIDGFRVIETGSRVPGGRLLRVFDNNGHLLGEYAGTTPMYEVAWLGETPVAVMRWVNGQLLVDDIFVDQIGTPILVVQTGTRLPLWHFENVDGFGATPPNESPAGQAPYVFNLRLPGQVFSMATGLYYNHHRDYDPMHGRYLKPDPLGISGGINVFAYASNNPITHSDPSGLFDIMNPATWPQLPQGVVDAAEGYKSLYIGLGRAAVHMYRRAGYSGSCYQQRAMINEANLMRIIRLIQYPKRQEQAKTIAKDFVTQHPEFVAGRVAATSLISAITTPYIGASVAAVAAMGDSLEHVDAFDPVEYLVREKGMTREQARFIASDERRDCECDPQGEW